MTTYRAPIVGSTFVDGYPANIADAARVSLRIGGRHVDFFLAFDHEVDELFAPVVPPFQFNKWATQAATYASSHTVDDEDPFAFLDTPEYRAAEMEERFDGDAAEVAKNGRAS